MTSQNFQEKRKRKTPQKKGISFIKKGVWKGASAQKVS